MYIEKDFPTVFYLFIRYVYHVKLCLPMGSITIIIKFSCVLLCVCLFSVLSVYFFPSVRACTCVSDRLSAVASSTLSGVDRYRWISNLFSRPDSCESEKTVRAFLRLQCFPGNSAWCWNKAGICIPAGEKKHSYNYPQIILTEDSHNNQNSSI